MANVWILGSMGWMPSAGRQTCCALVELEDELILLDAGTGVANLALCEDVVARHDRLSVLLSHYHLDHVAGLMYLKRFAGHMCVDVFGPGKPVYEKTTGEYMADVLQPAVYSSGHMGFAREVRYFDYGGRDFCVGSVRVSVRPQRHSAPSFEFRLDDVLVYATDSAFDAGAWTNVAPARVLLHECWQIADDDPRHTSAEALVRGIPHGVFDRVVLVHQNPAWTSEERAYAESVVAPRGFELARDGLLLEA